MLRLILLLAARLLAEVHCDESPVVISPAGKFRGRILKSRDGRDIHSFEGIPYAQPPVGQLRFQDPLKMPKLEGIYEAVNGSIGCFQPPLQLNGNLKNISAYLGTEDCLYLNVHKPKTNESSPLPVMFWIHGGAFFMGSGTTLWHGPEFLLDKDMILVTTNYRLGILGYLSTGDTIIPGNYGLKDQIMALKWVQENIASFGGDPKSVTIAGESAGAASVMFLTHSPLSKGLFHKAIAQSGSAYSAYALKSWKTARNQSNSIADHLGCSFESEQLLKCLQKMPIEELFSSSAAIQPSDILAAIHMSPVIEEPSKNAVITKNSLNEFMNFPMITGVTNREGILLSSLLLKSDPKYKDGVEAIRKDLDELIPKWGFYSHSPLKDNITEMLVPIYFGEGGTASATLDQITDFISDSLANYGVHYMAKTEKGPTYMYMLSYKGKNSIFEEFILKEFRGDVAHGEDLPYMFNSTLLFPKTEWPKEDLEVSKQIIDMWYNFMRNGDPTPESKVWKESEGGTKYLDITKEGLIMKSNMFQNRMESIDKIPFDHY